MGYNWMGCAGADHKRKYYPFPGGPYACPQNKSLARMLNTRGVSSFND